MNVTEGWLIPRSKKPTPLSAPAYVEALMTWTQTILDDEKHFPQKIGESLVWLDCQSVVQLGCDWLSMTWTWS
jgi:hypothetical protein